MTWLLLLFISEIIFFLVAFSFSGLDIMSPSVVMCVMFLLSTSFALAYVDEWNIDYSPDSCLLIASGLMIFFLSEICFRFIFYGKNEKIKTSCKRIYSNNPCCVKTKTLKFSLFLSVIIIFWYFLKIKSFIGSAPSIFIYFVLYRKAGIAAMAGKGEPMSLGLIKLFLQVLQALGYVSSYLLADALLFKKNIKRKLLYSVLMLLSLAPSIMSGGRSGFLRLGSAFVIEYYVLWHQKYGWDKNLSWKYIKIGIVSFIILALVFYYSLDLLGRKTEKNIIDYVATYLASSIELFNQYVKSPIPCESFGEESLYSVKKILSFLHIGNLSTHYNLEFRQIGRGHSNIYTFFRRPLHDFGILGMYVFTTCVSFLFSWFYYGHIKYRNQKESCMWVLAYGYLFYWLVCSPMIQYSITYISAGTIIYLILIYCVFVIFNKGFSYYVKIIKNKCIT